MCHPVMQSEQVTQADTSSEDWERLQSSLPDLASLAGAHDDDKIRKMARRLRKLVATHGVGLFCWTRRRRPT